MTNEWNITDKVEISAIRTQMNYCSDAFDNGNWCICLRFPNREFLSIRAVLLRWPLGISAIDVKYSITLEFPSGNIGTQIDKLKLKEREWDPNDDIESPITGKMHLNCPLTDLLDAERMKICVHIEIIRVYANGKMVENDGWKEHKFSVC